MQSQKAASELARLHKRRGTLIFRLMIMRPHSQEWSKTLRQFESVCYRIYRLERWEG